MNDICGRIADIRAQLGESCRLIAVSKNVDVDNIDQAIKCGQIDFAENYIQEAEAKWVGLKQKYPQVRLHLIGNLQKNKVRKALALFDYIHTLDSVGLIEKIAGFAEAKDKTFLIQVLLDKNSPAKHGILPNKLSDVLSRAQQLNLNIVGLMGVASIENPAADFKALADLAQQNNLVELSMGMSGDYLEAIEYGATMVRLGTAIFGVRQ
ncbi:MAG: YggS family pyridoxal phosphate-dependent enzyme [Alphaproteobacteria bacterium]|jgi:pyridoxal phosphate enzyme (YggS family)|nr:YggS family pyridoxal phosphate-dependent enzyme [Alphaproteobacteria bacterium]